MEEILRQIALQADTTSIQPLIRLVDSVRPARADDADQATNNLLSLTYLLREHAAYREALRHYLGGLLAAKRQLHLYADVGILPNTGFFTELRDKLNNKFLPPAVNEHYMRDLFGLIFHDDTDHQWIASVSDDTWLRLYDALLLDAPDAGLQHATASDMAAAIQVLSYRISGIGLEPELVRNYPDIERFESPFLRQNAEVVSYLEKHQAWLLNPTQPRDDCRHILVLLDQCDEIIAKIRKHATEHGVSISLTYLLRRLTQSLQRVRVLLALLEPEHEREEQRQLALTLFRTLVRATNQRNDMSAFVSANVELMARKVTEHAGRTGEHYVTHDRRDWWSMFRSAAGAGVIVGFMGMLKVLAARLHAPPLIEAFLFSMNYSLGFMLVHRLHFTIATKQPAMTAAHIAAAIDEGEKSRDKLVELVVKVMRSQFIAIIGNVVLAMPVAYAIAWGWLWLTGSHLAPPDKAHKLLTELNPIASLALPHAAIAGCCLFLAGLISGYYDNKVAYGQIPQRLMQRPWLRKLLGEQRLARFAHYIGENLGGLAGNFYFGIMLGSIGTIGFLFGLPLDIRHITFSSANFSFALVGLDHQLDWQTVAISLVGIALIGLTNLLVSFSLALWVALRARQAGFAEARSILAQVCRRFVRTPRQFFFPPKVVEQPS
ncbi:site-specific recombinase [Chitinivorax sp. PXF-14]|uniref:site-specific recombinase n=1 Tax=Chitinivorax sp. PXF-14 TaxID=3230488 RepID=UPI003466E497